MDNLSQRRCSSAKVALDVQSLTELNDYFAELCCDSAYKQPTPAQVQSGVQVPEISEREVWYCLQHLKKTATGPDLITFWVWRDHAEIFAPLICKIWNLSLRLRGTTQDSVSGPYLFSIFINDLEIDKDNHPALFKHADDFTLIVPVWRNGHCRTNLVDQFLTWLKEIDMICNRSKCKRKISQERFYSGYCAS